MGDSRNRVASQLACAHHTRAAAWARFHVALLAASVAMLLASVALLHPARALAAPTPPTALFTDSLDASAGTTNATGIGSPTPHFSLVNSTGATVNAQRTQVYSDILDSNVVALWHFDTSSGVATDSSGNGYALTMINTPSSPAGVTTAFNESLGLNGTNQYASRAATAALDLASDFTVQLWFKVPSNPASTSYLFEKGTGGNRNWTMTMMTNGKLSALVTAGTDKNISTTTAFGDNAWHLATLTVDATNNMRLYVDSVLEAGPLALGGSVTGGFTQPMAIGRWGGSSGGWLAGSVDDVEVLKRAWSPAEIAGYYRGRQPHATLLWDSDPTDAGIPLTSCNNAARCQDIVYGGPTINAAGARFWTTAKYKSTVGVWSPWSTPDWYETVVDQPPNAPAALAQYAANGSTAIAAGGWTSDGVGTNVVLKFTASDADASQTLTPWVEVVPNATPFSGTCGASGATMFSGSPVAAPTGGASYPMVVNVTGLTNNVQYHWRACAVDQLGATSAWLSSGGSPDFKVDSTAPSNPSQANIFDLDLTATADRDYTTNMTALSASWNAGADAESGIRDYSACFSTVNTGCTAIAGTAQQNGIAPGSRTMSATATGMSDGATYYVCVRSFNNAGVAAAAWQCSDGFLVAGTLTIDVQGYDQGGSGPTGASLNFAALSPPADVTGELRVTVVTNNPSGYSLSARDSDGQAGALNNGATPLPWSASGTVAAPGAFPGSGVAISAFAGGQTPARWCTGGQVNCTSTTDTDLLWAPLTAVDQQMSGLSTTTGGDITRVPLRVRVPAAQPPGSYTGSLQLTVVANP